MDTKTIDNTDQEKQMREKQEKQQEALIRGMFEMLDEDGDGHVAVAELGSTFERLGIANAQSAIDNVLRKSLSAVTGDKRSKSVNFEQFTSLYEAVMNISNCIKDDDKTSIKEISAEENVFNNINDDEMEEAVRAAFNLFDLDSNGYISAQELQQVLTAMGVFRNHDLHSCSAMIAHVDRNGDGHVDYDEFKHLLASGAAFIS